LRDYINLQDAMELQRAIQAQASESDDDESDGSEDETSW
jgi:hypothetical protein